MINALTTDKVWEPSDFIFKIDVITMYPSVNLKNAIHVAASALSQSNTNDCNQLNYPGWTYFFKIAHYKLEFMWDNNLWISTNGVSIGSPVGPHLAISNNRRCANEQQQFSTHTLDKVRFKLNL